jgi:hypothetical protein
MFGSPTTKGLSSNASNAWDHCKLTRIDAVVGKAGNSTSIGFGRAMVASEVRDLLPRSGRSVFDALDHNLLDGTSLE